MSDTQVSGTDAPAVADTADVQADEATVQVSEAPEATQDNVEAEETPTTEVEATDTAEKLYAGKYKSAEEMERAYQELQSKFTTTASEKAELSRILNEAFTEPAPQVQAQEDDFVEPDPINQEIDNLKRVTAVQSFVMNHQDANAEDMQKVLSEDPLVRQISGHEAKLEYAYLRSQNMSQQKAIAEAQKTGAQAATAKIAEKQTAQVETARKAEEVDEGADLLERATGNYSQEDRDKARRELIKRNLVNI